MKINFLEMKDIGIKNIYGNPTAVVEKVIFDSRRVTKGAAFICIKGERFDGHSFINQVMEQGATVVIGENKTYLKSMAKIYQNQTFIHVANAKIASARLSSLIYGACHEKLKTITVTGTNGKTTVTAYVRSLLNLLDYPTGTIGTLGIISSKGKIDFKKSTPTTPETPDLHQIFRNFHCMGEKAVAMETSSIAIEEKRVEGIVFDVGIHTNLSPEHLEYHRTYDAYKKAKLKMFDQVKTAVVNADDEGMGKEILERFNGPIITYSLNEETKADLIAEQIQPRKEGCRMRLRTENDCYEVATPILGSYNLANLLAAIGAVMQLGFKLNSIVGVLAHIEVPEGRFQLVETKAGRSVILDYAHTPVAMENLLTEVKKLPHRRLIILITGIGIRDFGKMPQMAAITEGRADEIVVSVDHPGFHDPQEIVDKVMTGFVDQKAENIHQALTRKEGVLTALSLAEEGDIVLLTSGCINGSQIVRDQYIPHSDEEIVESYFRQFEASLEVKESS